MSDAPAASNDVSSDGTTSIPSSPAMPTTMTAQRSAADNGPTIRENSPLEPLDPRKLDNMVAATSQHQQIKQEPGAEHMDTSGPSEYHDSSTASMDQGSGHQQNQTPRTPASAGSNPPTPRQRQSTDMPPPPSPHWNQQQPGQPVPSPQLTSQPVASTGFNKAAYPSPQQPTGYPTTSGAAGAPVYPGQTPTNYPGYPNQQPMPDGAEAYYHQQQRPYPSQQYYQGQTGYPQTQAPAGYTAYPGQQPAGYPGYPGNYPRHGPQQQPRYPNSPRYPAQQGYPGQPRPAGYPQQPGQYPVGVQQKTYYPPGYVPSTSTQQPMPSRSPRQYAPQQRPAQQPPRPQYPAGSSYPQTPTSYPSPATPGYPSGPTTPGYSSQGHSPARAAPFSPQGQYGSRPTSSASGHQYSAQQPQQPPRQQQPTQYYAHHPSVNVAGGDLCLSGCVFYIVSSPTTQYKTSDVATTIQLNGGVVDKEYGAKVTHVLVESMRHSIVETAMKDRRRCITACWLNDCIGQRRMTPPQKVVHLPSFYGDAKPVQSKLFAIHGFEESERSYLKMMIKAIGGTCTNYLSKAHDFVVAKSANGDKISKADAWHIPIVNVQWLTELSVGCTQVLNTFDHEVYRRFVNQPHTDVLNMHPSVFEQFDPIYTHLLSSWREPIGVPSDVWQQAQSTKAKMEDDMEMTPSKRIRLSPAPAEEDILLKTQQLDAAGGSGEMGRLQRLIFSGYLEDERINLSRKSRYLGAEIANTVLESSHVVCKRPLRRTRKLLEAIALGKIVVDDAWVKQSFFNGVFGDGVEHVLKDDEFQTQYSFNLARSVAKARKHRVFEDVLFYVTPSVKPSLSYIVDIIRLAGGRVCSKHPTVDQMAALYQRQMAFVLIACEQDAPLCKVLLECGIPAHSTEFVLTGILRHDIDHESHRLFTQTPQSTVPQGPQFGGVQTTPSHAQYNAHAQQYAPNNTVHHHPQQQQSQYHL